jgi:hypothetical protein
MAALGKALERSWLHARGAPHPLRLPVSTASSCSQGRVCGVRLAGGEVLPADSVVVQRRRQRAGAGLLDAARAGRGAAARRTRVHARCRP